MPIGSPGPVSPDRYVAALGGADPVESMEEAPKRLRRLCRGLTDDQLTRPAARGKWSIHRVVAHLTDWESVLGSRYRIVAALDRPPLLGCDQDALVERLGVEKVSTDELLRDFERQRLANVNLLRRLPAAAWHRVGLHSERGEESIDMMVKMYAGHDRIHEGQIETIRLALFPAESKPRGGTGRALARAVVSVAAAGAKRKLGSTGTRLALRGATILAKAAAKQAVRTAAVTAARRAKSAGKEAARMAAKKGKKLVAKAAKEVASKKNRKKAAKAGQTTLAVAAGLATLGARAARKKFDELSKTPTAKKLSAKAKALADRGMDAAKREGKVLAKLAAKKSAVLRKKAGKKVAVMEKVGKKRLAKLEKSAGKLAKELRKDAEVALKKSQKSAKKLRKRAAAVAEDLLEKADETRKELVQRFS